MKLKRGPMLILIFSAVSLGVYEMKHLMETGVISRPDALKTLIPLKADEIHAEVIGTTTNVALTPLPSTQPAAVSGCALDFEIWKWNAHMGALFANGGPTTTRGSLMEKFGANVTFRNQDDTGKMIVDISQFVEGLRSDPCAPGPKFITLMGDQTAQFFQEVNPKLKKLGDEYQAEIIGAFGYSGNASAGEDVFMGPQEWKDNCQAMRGGLTAGALREGDWNIALKKLGMCDIPNNPDDTVYDPTAMNWVNATYTDAAQKYVSNFCVDLPLKTNRKEIRHVCVNGVVTWTPGDVTVAQKRGGLVPILSTRESAFQMPCVIVGIRKFNRAHKAEIAKMLAGAFAGADQVRANPAALQKGGEVSSAVYGEEKPEYWVKYYKGVQENDMQGIRVSLGGSRVANYADNLQLFGLRPGDGNLFEATYTTFGKIVSQQYPNLVPTFPPAKEIYDTQYIMAAGQILQAGGQRMDIAQAATTTQVSYSSGAAVTPIKEIVGRRNYQIHFATGSANILPDSFGVLSQIRDDILMTNLAVALHGHTDSQGNPEGNMDLSRRRAASVQTYLEGTSTSSFPRGRIRVYPHGQDEPIASNATKEGMAKNRRVTVVMGTVQ